MASVGNWTILGDNIVAGGLREAARVIDADRPIMLATEPGDLTADAFAIGPTILVTSVERVVPYYTAYEALTETKRAIDAGEVGTIYGCFTSFRIPRGRESETIAYNALLPSLAVTLDLLASPVVRVHATRASLLAENDAWYITLRLEDDTIGTIEAMATLDPAHELDRDVLVEVTGSNRVLRAEPKRQSIVVEPFGAAATIHPWWEDLNERFLKLLVARAQQPPGRAGSRIRAVWGAVQESAESGEAVSIDPI